MASQPDLKLLHRELGAEDQEMQQYRNRFAQTLKTKKKRTAGLWLVPSGLALATFVWLLMLLPSQRIDFRQENIEDIETLIATQDAQALTTSAKRAMGTQETVLQLNAMATLCMLLPSREAIPIASKALQADPRAEFRVFYLEYLLEEADHYQINRDQVERLMDQEEDGLCFELYQDLLDVS